MPPAGSPETRLPAPFTKPLATLEAAGGAIEIHRAGLRLYRRTGI